MTTEAISFPTLVLDPGGYEAYVTGGDDVDVDATLENLRAEIEAAVSAAAGREVAVRYASTMEDHLTYQVYSESERGWREGSTYRDDEDAEYTGELAVVINALAVIDSVLERGDYYVLA